MRYFSFMLLCLVASCSRPSVPSMPPEPDLYKVLEGVSCPNESDFRGMGLGMSESDALAGARLNIAREYFSEKLKDTIQIRSQNINQTGSSNTATSTKIEASLINPGDAKLHYSKKQDDKVGVVVCMTRSDAAKGFVERLKPIAAALEFAANAAIDAKHPKDKSDAWQKTKPLWGEFMPLQVMIEGLDKEKAALFEPVAALYAKAKERYLDYCRTATLYWNPEAEEEGDFYSEIAFEKLSKKIIMEKATCKGNGISLIYLNTGHECKYAGMFRCSHKPSMRIASCYGEQYHLLGNPNVETFQKVEEVALRKLHEKLEYESFWGEWEQEIKKWRPMCE